MEKTNCTQLMHKKSRYRYVERQKVFNVKTNAYFLRIQGFSHLVKDSKYARCLFILD